MKITTKTLEIGGTPLKFEVGRFAEQATSAVLASYGDTMVLATVVASKRKTDLSYFPLFVEYIERLYAGGRIKGSRWVKREGRPSDDAILSGRLIDRSVRPLFPKGYAHEVQVIVTILSVDGENDPDIAAVNAVSAALAISSIPWEGPIGCVRLGYVPPKEDDQGHFLVNPSESEIDFCDMDLVVSSTKDKILMIEAGANEVPEPIFNEAFKHAKKEAINIVSVINDLVKEVGKNKVEYEDISPSDELIKSINKDYTKKIYEFVDIKIKGEDYGEEMTEMIDEIFLKYEEQYDKKSIDKAIDHLMKMRIRTNTLKKDQRPDGRKLDEIRKITGEVGILPRTHGSAVFQRGQTQALTVATLGSPSLEQLIESPMGEESKRYIHHYSMPPYSVGETGRVGFPKRREVGHGALAERALLSVIPPEDKFPYTIRLVSEVMSSNGSTSMASTCGSTLALMDAGVPIKNPVAGISIGLVSDGKEYKLLTDIIGLEDFTGDMDFKVAGTTEGITAIQLDVKNNGLTEEIIEQSIDRAKIARLSILKDMLAVIPKYRDKISQYAPKVVIVMVPKDKIGEVIGPGGRVIKAIIAETGSTVDVNDEGQVSITGVNEEGVNRAKEWVENLIKEVQVGEEYDGEVKRLMPFGAFVEVLPGKEGLVHVSRMSEEYINDPSEIVSVGQKVHVTVFEIDDQKRINLTMVKGKGKDNDMAGRNRSNNSRSSRPRRNFPPRRGGQRR